MPASVTAVPGTSSSTPAAAISVWPRRTICRGFSFMAIKPETPRPAVIPMKNRPPIDAARAASMPRTMTRYVALQSMNVDSTAQ